MKNREIFQRDPATTKLLNDGVAAVTESATTKEIETLRYELERFVCEGQYKGGLIRILESYMGNADSTVQPAAWVSGFLGSGKSHLLKMFRHLWVDTQFESDSATARGLTQLPDEANDLLRELDTLGKRCGGLHAAAGTLPSGGGESMRLAVLSIILRSKGLPSSLPQAQFCLWLQKNNLYEKVKVSIESVGKDFQSELHDLYVSPIVAQALLDADPAFAPDLKQARAALRTQFPVVKDVSTEEFIRIIRKILSTNGEIPCTVIVLDEIQLFIGDSAKRSTDVMEIAEAICKQLNSRVLLIGAGQTALAGSVPLMQRLRDRFTIPVELSDSDVETVTRRVVLAKKADKRKAIENTLNAHAGEIDRQLSGTRIGTRTEDRAIIVDDYPLLPVRRRFWEHTLRAVDIPGTSSQVRTQLRIVYDAVKEMAEKSLGTVMPADFIFNQLQPDLLRTGVLLREIDETVRNLDDGTPEGELAKRICGLVFLVRKLPREEVADIGVRATPEMMADLLISDLANNGATLRKEIPQILDKLVDKGKLIKIDEEYSLQTRESSEWGRKFRNRQTKLSNDLTSLSSKRSCLLIAACSDVLNGIKLLQGKCKAARKLSIHFGTEPPEVKGNEIPVWIRDGWGENESTALADARAAGTDSPVIYVYVPKAGADDLKKAITEYEAAKATIEFKGTPTTPEGQEARDSMTTRMGSSEVTRNSIIQDVINAAKVIQGGGQELFDLTLKDKVNSAAEISLDRLFPNFQDADDDRWHTVINRAKSGSDAALQAVDWNDAPEKHQVCSAIISEIGSGKKGKDIRDAFESAPYGWPRDAIDAALITLFTTDHIRVTHKGVQLKQGQLDQAKMSVSDFRVETITIDARARIKLRKLFQGAGIPCKPDEESIAASQFLTHLSDMADRASGDPPMPERPSTDHLDNLRVLAGNEQLAEILNQYKTLSKQVKDWSALADLATKRKPAWETLQLLLKHNTTLPESQDLNQQVNAVHEERRLLDKTDPVPAIHKDAVTALRKAVKRAYDDFKAAYDHEMTALEDNDNWNTISSVQQEEILFTEEIADIPDLSIGDDSKLVQSLEETSITIWKTKIDALPKQFSNAAVSAARLLEPETQTVKLTSGTLKTEDDVRNWIEDVEKNLLDKIQDGPIVIS
ncbi:MAG: BREX system P-loop protein BrxC [Thermodesulfobacteriota bacterium]|nr:BREX system P-loop protein BrxC [Thermodesulfobacteriota bacterium]